MCSTRRTSSLLSLCCPVRIDVKGSLWLHYNGEVPNRAIKNGNSASTRTFGTLTSWFENARLRKTEIEKMLTENVIGPAQTEWAPSIVFVSKKDETLRFLRRLSKDYRSNQTGIFPDTTHGRMHRRAWQSDHLFDVRRRL